MKLLHQLPLLAATSLLAVSASSGPPLTKQQQPEASPMNNRPSADQQQQQKHDDAAVRVEESEERTKKRKGQAKTEPREEDLIEAADFGVQAMNDLYAIKEPKLYSMGLFLSSNNPARFVAAFNRQTDEAKSMAKFGYAALEAAKQFRSKFPDLLRTVSFRQSPEKSVLRRQCPRQADPECLPASSRYRTADGSCNNREQLWWGSAMSTMQRLLPPSYEDGIESIRRSASGDPLPSARQVSDYIHQERDAPLTSVTHMLMQWGQFVDHDVTATGQSSAFNGSVPQCCLGAGQGFQPPELSHPDCLPIAVHADDSHLGELGVRCLEFVRSGPAPREDCEIGAREQLSQVTSFVDASTVYSSSARQSDGLRIFRNGLLRYGRLQSRRPLLPRDDSDLCLRGSLSSSCFRAGDGRLSEQPALTSLHVVFLRLHNRLATKLSALNRNWSDERIFQEARKIVAAVVQHITYREFLPIVLGHEVTKIFDLELARQGYYGGYDKTANPNVANAFSSAAFRFGHSLVQRSFARFDRHHRPMLNNVSIHEEFSNPANLESAGSVDRILLGLINQAAQKRDEFISEELTNHLFQTPGFPFGMDLASLNIQRGRDHGIPPYVEWRRPCALSPILEWKHLERAMSSETANKFRDIYAAVEDIDLFSAGLAEKPVAGGLVGPTFACIIAQQFRNLRRGDRFWYENPFPESGFSPEQLQQIRRVTLAQVLCQTMDNIDAIQPFVMLKPDDARNQRLECENPVLGDVNLDAWVEGKRSGKSDREVEPRAATQRRPSPKLPPAPQRKSPVRTRINQQNRITVRRPLGPNENLTIVVNNHAVNSPIFVTDSIYGSNVLINRPLDDAGFTGVSSSSSSSSGYNKPSEKPHDNFFTSTNAYYPHNFHDPSNPNPPNYGGGSSNKPAGNRYPGQDAHNEQHGEDAGYSKKTTTTTTTTTPSYHPTSKKPDYGSIDQNTQYTHGQLPSQFTDTNTPNVNRPTQNAYSSQTGSSFNPYFYEFEPNQSDNDRPSKNPYANSAHSYTNLQSTDYNARKKENTNRNAPDKEIRQEPSDLRESTTQVTNDKPVDELNKVNEEKNIESELPRPLTFRRKTGN